LQTSDRIALDTTILESGGGWYAARCYTYNQQAAHTSPIYVRARDGGFHDRSAIRQNIALCEQYLQEIQLELEKVNNDTERQMWRYKKLRLTEARVVLERLKKLK
jgi:hypothetical protein